MFRFEVRASFRQQLFDVGHVGFCHVLNDRSRSFFAKCFGFGGRASFDLHDSFDDRLGVLSQAVEHHRAYLTEIARQHEALDVLFHGTALARRLTQQLADGARQGRCLAQVQGQAQEQIARGVVKERVFAFPRKEHVADAHDVLHPQFQLVAHIEQRVVAMRLAFEWTAFTVLRHREGIEQVDLLPMPSAELRRDEEVFHLHVQDNDGLVPIEQVGDHDADPFAGSRRRGQQHELQSRKNEKSIFPLADDDAVLTEQAGFGNLCSRCKTGLAVQGANVAHRSKQGNEWSAVAECSRCESRPDKSFRHTRIALVVLPVGPPCHEIGFPDRVRLEGGEENESGEPCNAGSRHDEHCDDKKPFHPFRRFHVRPLW